MKDYFAILGLQSDMNLRILLHVAAKSPTQRIKIRCPLYNQKLAEANALAQRGL